MPEIRGPHSTGGEEHQWLQAHLVLKVENVDGHAQKLQYVTPLLCSQ